MSFTNMKREQNMNIILREAFTNFSE